MTVKRVGINSLHIGGGTGEGSELTVEAFREGGGKNEHSLYSLCVEEQVYGIFDLENVLMTLIDGDVERQYVTIGFTSRNGDSRYVTFRRGTEPGDHWNNG